MGGEPDQVKWRGVQPVSGLRGVWPARNAVRISEDALKTGSGNSTLYTVPESKILFISSALLTTRLSADAQCRGKLSVYTDGDTEVNILLYQLLEKAGQLCNNTQFIPAIEVPAAYYINVDSNHANLSAMGFINGWLEDA